MKKLISIVVLATLLTALCACSAKSNVPVNEPVSNGNSEVNPVNTDSEDYSPIIGSWNEADVLDSRLLTVYEDRTYSLEYPGSGTEYGTVAVEYTENPDGSKNRWYVLYNAAGEVFASFQIDPQDGCPADIYSGQDGSMHFERVMEGQGGEDVTRGEAYVGVWGCGRCTITIDPVSDRYEVQVTWASSAAEHTYWTYECYYDEATGHLRGENGVRTNVLTNDDGSEKEDVVYEDGVCEFHITIDGELVWEDKEDGVGDGMYFQKN